MDEINLKIKNAKTKYVGYKQLIREEKCCDIDFVVLAEDADFDFRSKVEKFCKEKKLAMFYAPKMIELGASAGISIGAGVVTVLKEKTVENE